MAAKLYSDVQENIDALASRIEHASSFDGAQAANIALQLLGRKQLKIKSGALAQIFRSLDREIDTKACRDELIAAGILERLPGSGVDGKPAVYRIVADAQLPSDDDIEDVTPEVVEVEVERMETVETTSDGVEDVATEAGGSSAEDEPKREFVSMVGRGAARNTRSARSKRQREPEKAAEVEDSAASGKDTADAQPVRGEDDRKQTEEKPEAPVAPEPKPKRQRRVHRDQSPKPAEPKTAGKKAAGQSDAKKGQRSGHPAKEDRKTNDQRGGKQHVEAPSGSETHASKHVPISAVARVLGGRIVKASPVTKALARVKHERRDIVKVDRPAKQAEKPRKQNEGRSLRESVALIAAWAEQHNGTEVPFASRRQRAYEILGDEKAFDGKSGERLLKKLNEKGITPLTLKMAPNRPSHFMGFYAIGANKPFIVVENLDTYDEIARLLKGKRNVKLFGTKVGGVIFGGGCKASVSHALDEYLSDIGYAFDYVYYAGDIDREGARIIEQTRAANVIQIRMHVGIYRAMIAEHKRRLKEGSAPEPAATMQGVPQNLATTIKDLPMVARVQFRNILRDNQRVPQEILMSEAYRDASSDQFERMLNK